VAFPRLVAALDITKLAQPTLESIMVGGVLASLTKIWILWSWFSGHLPTTLILTQDFRNGHPPVWCVTAVCCYYWYDCNWPQ